MPNLPDRVDFKAMLIELAVTVLIILACDYVYNKLTDAIDKAKAKKLRNAILNHATTRNPNTMVVITMLGVKEAGSSNMQWVASLRETPSTRR
jgi:hypothetical protein